MKSVINTASLLVVAAMIVGCGKENVGEQRAETRSQESANLVGSYSSVCDNNTRYNLKLEGEKFRVYLFIVFGLYQCLPDVIREEIADGECCRRDERDGFREAGIGHLKGTRTAKVVSEVSRWRSIFPAAS